jgi:uncharacterized protein RhaS with RHS repeats
LARVISLKRKAIVFVSILLFWLPVTCFATKPFYRTYQPDIGRWLNRDEYQGSQDNPQTKNRYIYVENNPLNKVDPTGRISVKNAVKQSRPGDIIMSRFSDYWFIPGYWKHAFVRVRGKTKPLVTEMGKSEGGKMAVMEKLLNKRGYDNLAIVRIKATPAQKNSAQRLSVRYAYMYRGSSWYQIYSNYKNPNDGLNCSEFVWRSYYIGTNGKIDLVNKKYMVGSSIKPDSLVNNRFVEKVIN